MKTILHDQFKPSSQLWVLVNLNPKFFNLCKINKYSSPCILFCVYLVHAYFVFSVYCFAHILYRGIYPPAEQYLTYAEQSCANLVEGFKKMQFEEAPAENGDLDLKVCTCNPFFTSAVKRVLEHLVYVPFERLWEFAPLQG